MENSNLKALLLAIIVLLTALILMRLTGPGGVKQEVIELGRGQSARLAREIIEEGRIPDEIREKYTTVVRPASRSSEGRVIANDMLVLPPYSRARVRLQTYCLDRPLPAPASGEKMHLIDISQLLIEEFIPIYEKLMRYSASHPEATLQIQRIVWFMRFLSEGLYVPSYELVYEDRQLLESIYPGSTEIIENQKRRIFLKQQILKGLNILLQNLPEEVKEVLETLRDLGYDVNNPPGDLEAANRIVSRTLEIINSMSPVRVTVMGGDGSEYTLLTNDVAVKTEHPGGAGGTTLIVANPTPVDKTMDFKQYALESGRRAQRLGIGGIKSVEWEQARWKERVRPPAARPLPMAKVLDNVPYIHQVYGTPDNFVGSWACGPTSAVMILAYYKRIPVPGQWGNYGDYVAKEYTYGGYTFDHEHTERTPCGTAKGKGAWGYIWKDHGNNIGGNIKSYLELHDLKADYKGYNEDDAKALVQQEINENRPLIAATRLSKDGHFVVIVGYEIDINGKFWFIVNDPFGRAPYAKCKGNNVQQPVKYSYSQLVKHRPEAGWQLKLMVIRP